MKRTTNAAAIAAAMIACALMVSGCAQAAAEQPRQTEQKAEFASEPSEQVEQSEAAAASDAVDEAAPTVDEEAAPDEQAENCYYSDSEGEWDGDYYENDYEYVYYDYIDYSGSGSTATTLEDLLNGQGRAYDENGQSYTYYGDVCGHLDIPGENVDENGVIHDGDGYIVVAADSYERGEVIDTPYGQAKNYDSGGGYGNVDIYCDLW